MKRLINNSQTNEKAHRIFQAQKWEGEREGEGVSFNVNSFKFCVRSNFFASANAKQKWDGKKVALFLHTNFKTGSQNYQKLAEIKSLTK